jgi:hypothetical protein
MFLSMAMAHIIPEPTSVLTWYMIDWLAAYKQMFDPLFARGVLLWSLYVLPCTWYLALAALAAYWGTRAKLSGAFVRIAAITIFGFLIGSWLAANPMTMPMSYDAGHYILVASIICFAFLLIVIYVEVRHGKIQTDALK